MKTLKITTFILLTLCFVQASRTSPEPIVFVASTPCDLIPRIMLSIPVNADCEFIKWNLALYLNTRNQTPTTYTLHYTYGMTQPNTTGFMNGGTSLKKTGEWKIQKDNASKPIYLLTDKTLETSLSFVRLEEKLLHLLDPNGKLMIGHEGWSYTLNRK